MKKFLLIVVFFMIFVPVISVAQSLDQKACLQGKTDAKTDINKPLWQVGGCLFGIFALGAAYLIEPSPPASKLLGKSPEYVASYSACYTDEGASIQRTAALQGCLVGCAVSVIINSIVMLGTL
jgi:hypothetical protein